MKIYPVRKAKIKETAFADLSPLERKTRKVALAVACLSVFFFLFKILFL